MSEATADEAAVPFREAVAEAMAPLRLEEREALADDREEMMLALCDDKRDEAEDEAEAMAVSSCERVEVMIIPDMDMEAAD